MKILVRGGSIPAGVGVRRSYVDILKERYAPMGVEVINRSRAKETSFEGVETFDEDITPFNPNILIVHFGIDDAFHPVYRSEFQENLVQMVRLARDRYISFNLLSTSHSFDNINDMNAVNLYYNSIMKVSKDLDCILVPVHVYWPGYLHSRGLSTRDFVQDDARYPNEKGHEIYAEAFIWQLNRIFELTGFAAPRA
jgi:hypothetical protein